MAKSGGGGRGGTEIENLGFGLGLVRIWALFVKDEMA